MAWPDTDRDRLIAAHRAICILLGQVEADGSRAAVDFALADDTAASVEVLAATGRVNELDEIPWRRERSPDDTTKDGW